MIEVAHLTKAYGPFYAVQDVSFSVARGEIVGFLGPNGAGKSTTLKILAGFLGMTSGKVSIGGHDVVDARDEARQQLGYMPEATPLYLEMRVREYLAYRAELKRVPARDRKARVAQAMEEARVSDVAELLIGKLSKGFRQRVGLADALVARPPILILDEPTAGLDPNQIREVRELVRALGEKHTVLLSTHILSEVEATCGRAIVVSKGKLVAEGPLDELRKRRRSTRARVVVRGTEPDARRALDGHDAVDKLTAEADGAHVALTLRWTRATEDTDRALEAAVARLVGAGLGVREAAPEKATLDEVFASLTEDSPDSGDDAGGAAA